MAKVLIQNIADALNLSRTTVSKVLNNSGSVAPATRERVLQKAAEMNYKYFSLLKPAPEEQPAASEPPSVESSPKSIAFLFAKDIDNQHICFSMLPILGQIVSSSGFTLSLYPVSKENLFRLTLPDALNLENIAAIFCAEIFDRSYTEMLCSLKKPLLFFDAYAEAIQENLKADILLMENQYHLSSLTESIINRYHLSHVGFIGPYMHCLSFYERWLGFHLALQKCNLTYKKEMCIISQNEDTYFNSDRLLSQLKRMERLPDLFVCTNDCLAIQVMAQLKQLNFSVPSDVMLIGFDNSPQSSMCDPLLTTIDSHSTELGACAAEMLIARIKNPELPYRIAHVGTEPIYRESTGLRPGL